MGTKVTWIDKKLYAKIKTTLTPLLRDIPNDVLLHIAKGQSYSHADLTNWEITRTEADAETGHGGDAVMLAKPTLTWLAAEAPNNAEKLKVYYKNPHLLDSDRWDKPLDPKAKSDSHLYDSFRFTIRLFALNALRYRDQHGTLNNHSGERAVSKNDIEHAHHKLECDIDNEFKTDGWLTFSGQLGRTVFYAAASLFFYTAGATDKETVSVPLLGDYPASKVLKTAGGFTSAAAVESGLKCKGGLACAFWYSGKALQKKVCADVATMTIDIPHAPT